MKGCLKHFAVAVLLGAVTLMPVQADASAMHVPDDIYEWVQSSSRINYYFNKREIHYDTDESGKININVLKVPVLKTYDAIQIDDVLQKRRWREADVDGYGDLAGEADYLTINLEEKKVTVEHVDLIDSQMWTMERTSPKSVFEIDKMSEKNKEAIFYKAILAYEKKHGPEIAKQSKGELKHSDAKHLEKEREAAEEAEKERNKENND